MCNHPENCFMSENACSMDCPYFGEQQKQAKKEKQFNQICLSCGAMFEREIKTIIEKRIEPCSLGTRLYKDEITCIECPVCKHRIIIEVKSV